MSTHELETSTDNTPVDKVPLPHDGYTIFYETCVISDASLRVNDSSAFR